MSDSARSSMPRPRGGGEPPPIGLDAFIWLGVLLLLLEAGGCAEAGRRRLGGCWPLALAAEVGVHVALAALVGRWRARGCGGGGSWAALRLHSGLISWKLVSHSRRSRNEATLGENMAHVLSA